MIVDSALRPDSGARAIDRSPTTETVRRAVEQLNAGPLAAERLELRFVHDAGRNRSVIQLVNRETHEVVRQLPPEDVLRIARRMSERSA